MNEDARLKQLELDLKREEDAKAALQRGQQAIAKEKALISQATNMELTRRNIEQKQKVKQFETQVSHTLAAEFRQKEKERLAREAIEKQREDALRAYAIDKYGNKIDHCIKTNNAIDYTNTCFHNALIVKHDSDQSRVALYPDTRSEQADPETNSNDKTKGNSKSATSKQQSIKSKLQQNSKQK